MSTNQQLIAMLRSFCCAYGQKPNIKILKRTTVKEFFCHQKVGRITQVSDKSGEVIQLIEGKQEELLEKKVYYLSSEHPKPGTYKAIGWVKSHPKTQQVTFLIESLEPQEDDFEKFKIEENIENLKNLQTIRIGGIINDLREHVTRIYKRDEILTTVLLTYCSPRWLYFNHRQIRGWMVSFILGDAGSGKTQTFQSIADFIGVGDMLSGLTGSRTGLSYALVEHKQKGWQVKIGRYPANSRKLLAVDEVQFIPDKDIRTISKAMEEGFLQIDRVQSSGYESQTRLLLIGNPKRDRVMDGYSFGCDAIETIFDPTIIRRIDIVVFANYGDINDFSFINKKYVADSKPKVTSKMLRSLIFWAWNLKPEQVIFSEDATQGCLDEAKLLSEKFGYEAKIPLITKSDIRNKIARIAASFAVLDVSTNDQFTELHILQKHADRASKFLEDIYGAENCQLDERSLVAQAETQLLDYKEIEDAFKKKQRNEKRGIDGTSYFTDIIKALRIKDVIRRDHLSEQVGCKPDTLTKNIRLFKKYCLIDSGRDGYMKTPKFNKFLRRFLNLNPDFLKTEEVDNSEH